MSMKVKKARNVVKVYANQADYVATATEEANRAREAIVAKEAERDATWIERGKVTEKISALLEQVNAAIAEREKKDLELASIEVALVTLRDAAEAALDKQRKGEKRLTDMDEAVKEAEAVIKRHDEHKKEAAARATLAESQGVTASPLKISMSKAIMRGPR